MQETLLVPFNIPKFRAEPTVDWHWSQICGPDLSNSFDDTSIQKPSMKDCGVVAKSLITAHPFLKDDEGDGEV